MLEPQPPAPPTPPRRRSMDVPADLTVYAALAGRTPSIDPSLSDPLVAARLAVRADPWSPAVVGVYLREVVRAGGTKLARPDVAAWVRRQSAVARRRLAETPARVTEGAVSVGPREAAEEESAER